MILLARNQKRLRKKNIKKNLKCLQVKVREKTVMVKLRYNRKLRRKNLKLLKRKQLLIQLKYCHEPIIEKTVVPEPEEDIVALV